MPFTTNPARWRHDDPGRETTRADLAAPVVQWRALGWLFGAGGSLGLLILALGVDDSFDVALIGGMAAAGVLTGVTFLVAAVRLPIIWMAAALTLAVAMVSVVVVASGEADTPFALLYIWIAVTCWYFLSPRRAAGITALTVVASAVSMALATNPEDNALSWWVMVSGTLAATSSLAAVLRLRADRLVATLADAASRDALTGLLNRTGLRERAETELARARRHDLPVGLVLADLDDFKGVNDAHGHDAGDEVLRAFAALVRSGTRPEDIAARLGGEEFVLVLPHTGAAGTVAAAERLRRGTRTSLAAPKGRRITVSLGVAVFPADGATLDELLTKADQAMYRAKSLGRDRTERAA
jgi:diguanylate cyclase (GGDEF)-like protein